ncbi:MAG: carbohydrate ABC transporter permease [bacterium]
MRTIERFSKFLGQREAKLGYLLVLPAVVLILTLVAYPFVLAVYWSLTDKVVGRSPHFVGLRNFIELFQSAIFLRTARNSFVYTLSAVGLKFILGMGMALLLNQKFRGRNFLRGLYLLPWIVPMAISGVAWIWMYDSVFGVINYTIKMARISDTGWPWLANSTLAIIAVIVANVWRGTPFFGISLLAGLQAIPTELYEAAEVDGAGRLSKFFNITMPQLRHIILIVTLFSTIWTFADFETVYVITRGGPANTTHLFATLSYQVGLVAGQLGKGTAISLFIFPVLLLMMFLELKYVRRTI